MTLQEWLEEVYGNHAEALFRFLLGVTGSETETKDVLQEIFVRLANSPHLLDGVHSPRSYLFRMAHRLATDRYRRMEVRKRNEDHFYLEQEQASQPDLGDQDAAWVRHVLASAMETLPFEQREVLALKIWEEMTFIEIAEILNVSANTVASRYRYSLDKLRDALRPHYGDLP